MIRAAKHEGRETMLDRLTGTPCTCSHEAESHLKSQFYNLGAICLIPGCNCIRYVPKESEADKVESFLTKLLTAVENAGAIPMCDVCGDAGRVVPTTDGDPLLLCAFHEDEVLTKARELTEE